MSSKFESTHQHLSALAMEVPLAKEKIEGITTPIIFLGILIDSIRGELRLPPEKLDRLHCQIRESVEEMYIKGAVVYHGSTPARCHGGMAGWNLPAMPLA